MIKIDLLTPDEEGPLEDFLGKCESSLIQHSLNWRSVVRDLGTDEPFFIVAKKNNKIQGVLPLYYYKCKFGSLLTTNAWHTITGITAFSNVNHREIYEALLNYSIEKAQELDCAALSVGTNPFLNDKEYYSEYLKPDYAMENFIQYIDLTEIFDKHGNIIHPNYEKRTHLGRNLKKAQLQRTTISDEQKEDNIHESFKIYWRRMKELNAASVPERMFDSIYENLVSKGRGRFLFALNQGRMISSASLLFNNRIMDIYTMCMDAEYCGMRSNYLLVFYILKWAYKNGISTINWQSSPKKGDGVYRWKEQWGSHERTFLYLTKAFQDVSLWKNISLDELREAYRFHYLLPFNLLKSENSSKFTTKNEVSCFLSRAEETEHPAQSLPRCTS